MSFTSLDPESSKPQSLKPESSNAANTGEQQPSFDLVALGETMLTLYRDLDTPANAFAWDVCGAESNVALYCAALGRRSAWVSRLDTGMAGSLVLEAIAGSGVDTSLVELCDDAPTGLMLRDSPQQGQRVQYYRQGSAASLMSPETMPVKACLDARVLHLTGITLALSPGCRELVMALLSEPSDALRSFDVNWRSALWPQGPPGDLFAEAANRADIVFVGLDEAEAVWGFTQPSQVRALLSEPSAVVVKDGGIGVHVFTDSDVHFEPALRGSIVGPRGAGDAFAAGFLAGCRSASLRGWRSASLRGWRSDRLRGDLNGELTHSLAEPCDIRRCARLGHVVAMSAMVSQRDVGALPEADAIEDMLDADASTWANLVYPSPATTAGHSPFVAQSPNK